MRREWQKRVRVTLDMIDLCRMNLWPIAAEEVWPKGGWGRFYEAWLLTIANDSPWNKAHDALSDVYGTIEIAKLFGKRT